ncbi:MAG: hypothetical protein V1698_02555 [bacterium]
MKFLNKKQKSFSLIGVMFAAQIMAVAILAFVSATTRMIINSRLDKNKIIATGLAQEGIEILRNIRDNNFAAGAIDWKNGLNCGGGGCQVEYDNTSLVAFLAPNTVKYDDTNFYSTHSTGDTKFSRTVGLFDGGDFMQIGCHVHWTDFGQNYLVALDTEIWNWQKP